MKKQYLELLKGRRSRYNLKKSSPLREEDIGNLVEDIMLHTPSAFNIPTFRIMLLFGKEQDDLWDITKEEIRKIIPDISAFPATERKMEVFKQSFGTILVFEDTNAIHDLEVKYPLYKENFKEWSSQQTAMLELGLWIALAENGIGASLQHYNPIIDSQITARYNVPSDWRLSAQMPFGVADAPDGLKNIVSVRDMILIKK